ncbi:phage tail sheath subtilisin-like domain-containing protein [Micromonospora soli]|uniref:phage tail sheath C-terminal domain-containing protein n=1 Tax=Micromonospora sp. NBRC 110009 TaxID=3061627 RepID=UPI002673BC89|nr:phage tail sheath C-terminal domain-containing protein [Micromonospora sp. NBRC 110009]WKT96880.1 phage tail sheath subtilisin-like domain-containing protein [Micromonospora sp. NBRC 110009]
MTRPGLALGAPGAYHVPPRAALRLSPERLDVAGFAGVAPRGPIDVPTAVDSWSDYRLRFGGMEGPGLLPYAVHAFFLQGGVRARVLRVSPLPRDPRVARARHRMARMPGPIDVLARDEGTWGNLLTLRWDFAVAQRFETAYANGAIVLPAGVDLPPCSLVRLRGPGLPPAGVFAWSAPAQGFEVPVAPLTVAGPPPPAGPLEADVVTSAFLVVDTDPTMRREERFTDLGLRRGHPRFAGQVLACESLLVEPDGWPDAVLPPDVYLTSALGTLTTPGSDRYPGVSRESFFGDVDPRLLPIGGADGLDELGAVYGVDRLALDQEIGLLAVPDLAWSFADPPGVTMVDRPRPATTFGSCAPPPVAIQALPPPTATQLDARTKLAEIQSRQLRVAVHAAHQRRFVALLDAPHRLPVRRIVRWRSAFDSSYCAAYHPWLGVVGPGDVPATVLVPPCGFAAGIIADREIRLGLPWGPANELAAGAVLLADPVSDADHDLLHPLGVDVFRAERDGFRLTSARTLARDPAYRQLSVRRLMTMLRITLDRQLQPLVFEPNTARLRAAVREAAVALLRQLFRGGAFTGATEAEAFFVRCDDALNPAWSQAQGRLIAEMGVAPAEPLEFIVLRVSQDAAGGLTLEAGE